MAADKISSRSAPLTVECMWVTGLGHTTGMAKPPQSTRSCSVTIRHTDMRLTMNVYTDPRVFDLAGAVEKLPTLPVDRSQPETAKATGTDGAISGTIGRSEGVSGQQAGIGSCSAV